MSPRETEIAMVMRLWDLGLGLVEAAAALGCSTRIAAGIVHGQLCASRTAQEAAGDARLAGWWQSLIDAARDVRAGRRTPARVATEYGTTSRVVQDLANAVRIRPSKRGPSVRIPVLGKLYTAWEYGITATDAAMMAGIRIRTAQRYYQAISAMDAAQRVTEAARVEADRWVIVEGEFIAKESLRDG